MNYVRTLGFDVDISPMCVTAQAVARMAVDNDVHVVGIVAQNSDPGNRVPLLIGELEKQDAWERKVILSSGHLTGQAIGENQDYENLAGRSAGNILNQIGA